ncbi:MAG TPA: aminoacetone oxidase family FAD-binding enzyme [Coxiellaceae bacterium]|nr:aminoacetone oxidase family FAD-binding enzyme [Coxiellaceae bacterium]
MKNHYQTVIIGAGASGLFCAIEAAKRGRTVLVIDHESLAGQKIFVSGGGHCNFTNRMVSAAHYLSQNPAFCISALKRFSSRDMLTWMDEHGIVYREKEQGQLFCEGPAQQVIRALLDDCARYQVQIAFNVKVQAITKAEQFEVMTHRAVITAESLVVATGGLSYPPLGASNFGYRLAKQFGLNIILPRPGLVPLQLKEKENTLCEALAGVSFLARVKVREQFFCDQLLFTHQGLSGPAILQVSSYWQMNDALEIDTLPEINLTEHLKKERINRPKTMIRTCLYELLPKRFVMAYAQDKVWFDQPLADCSDALLERIAAYFHHWLLHPTGTLGYTKAEVTVSGIDTQELSSKTFEAKKIPGLYFIGEVIDVTGQLGGYNLQWAWSSGYCAGQFV